MNRNSFESDPQARQKEFVRSQVAAIRYMLDLHVKPHVLIDHPHVLIVGMRDRFAEAFAIFDSFQPKNITAIDISSNWLNAMRYWIHVLYERPGQAATLLSSVSIKQQDVGMLEENYDIVCAFSISPFLQNQDSINTILSRSHGLTVITARKSSGIFWDSKPEHTHIDQLIERSGKQIIVRDQRISLPSSDGHLWVASLNEN